jgi:hypothetical protein
MRTVACLSRICVPLVFAYAASFAVEAQTPPEKSHPTPPARSKIQELVDTILKQQDKKSTPRPSHATATCTGSWPTARDDWRTITNFDPRDYQ